MISLSDSVGGTKNYAHNNNWIFLKIKQIFWRFFMHVNAFYFVLCLLHSCFYLITTSIIAFVDTKNVVARRLAVINSFFLYDRMAICNRTCVRVLNVSLLLVCVLFIGLNVYNYLLRNNTNPFLTNVPWLFRFVSISDMMYMKAICWIEELAFYRNISSRIRRNSSITAYKDSLSNVSDPTQVDNKKQLANITNEVYTSESGTTLRKCPAIPPNLGEIHTRTACGECIVVCKTTPSIGSFASKLYTSGTHHRQSRPPR